MVSVKAFRKFALTFPEAIEQPHFEKTSFRVKKKIFAALDEKRMLATVKFSPVDQSVFTDAGKGAVYAVPGAWGKSGYTYVDLNRAKEKLVEHAVTISYCNVAPKKLAAAFDSNMK